MAIIDFKNNGKYTLREILDTFDNADIPFIEFRCKWYDESPNGERMLNDEFFGACEYKNGELISLDHDTYSLDDRYNEYEEFEYHEGGRGVTVWEWGETIYEY